MNIIDAVILGIVGGITEFLPISSTAHIILVQNFLGIPAASFVTTFAIIIQLGAMMSVIGLVVKAFLEDKKNIIGTIVAMIPTIFVGILVYPLVKHIFLSHAGISIVAMGVGGVFLIVFERLWKNKETNTEDKITKKQAFIVGCFQVLSFIPGVSRSAATIVGGMVSGLSRYSATLFSFVIALPTMLAASVYDLSQSSFGFSSQEWGILTVGFLVSWVIAHVVVRWFLRFVQTTTLEIFGWYRVVFAIVAFVGIIVFL
ncbi:MAG: undecaprenyl-diphosphate phosphatase [Candidatus Pacebacteria bacterium]|nr:undecaprenyl-diphosphate phosphatase [Candidatus Paceibacterota bacterium]